MDLNLIQTFLVVAEFQSYTKAAEQLGLTQPAVSAAIKRLEQVVDKQLFVKKRPWHSPDFYRSSITSSFSASGEYH
ncbi:Bacterial regulatory helix-turn-helix protein [Vibrio sp. B1FLJ16]|nr:Bacterial regulatory helix-turn-helix protein [Vibrio sp. B1FLJ16]CAE6941688.1 Bacterial regulatory helix-turn-helix protein [Vibrio sp. B1FLJ16]